MAATGTDGRNSLKTEPKNLGPILGPRGDISGDFMAQTGMETSLNDGGLSMPKNLGKTAENAILTGYFEGAGPRGGMVDTGDLKSPGE